MRNSFLLFFVSCVAVLTGCIWHSGINEPYFKVQPSGLNWVSIRQYETAGLKRRVQLRIDGSGIVEVRDGTSALVSNQFAVNHKHENWEDIREKRITISEEDTTLLFQSLVDAGLFEKYEGIPFLDEAPTLSTNETAMIYVSANINNKTVGSSDPVTKPELLEQLKVIILTFYQPQPLRRKR